MSRNTESRFAMNPTNIDMQRSTFNRNHSLKTSFNVGDIIPIFCDEVLPGDTFNVKTSKVVRMQSLITPLMDNMYLDTYFFFVPNRLVWEHWQEFCGENTTSPWVQQTVYQIPQLVAPASTGWTKGTIADYFGIPTNIPELSVNALPFRAYALICNEWFRDENLQNPLNIPVGDSTVVGVNTGTFVTDVAKGGLPYKACKFHDLFTSCLPGPLKARGDVMIPFAGFANDYTLTPMPGQALVYGMNDVPLQMRYLNTQGVQSTYPVYLGNNAYDGSSSTWYKQLVPMKSLGTGNSGTVDTSTVQSTSGIQMNVASKEALNAISDTSNHLSGLYADISGFGVTINQLRLAFQIQKLYEKDARGGTRYIELLKSHFGVTSPDARLQRPEYLGGNRIPININQVVQQSETSTTPQGNTAAYSLTVDSHSDFMKSFVEHGYIIGVAVARYDHTYQQGLNRMWSRLDRFDFYWPVLANIGEQPILNKEIWCEGPTGTSGSDGYSADGEVFGYQEAWADYRYKPSYVTGEMRSNYATSLDSWHLADDYNSLPYLGDSWIVEDSSNVDRVIAVSQRLADQMFGDFYFQCKTTRAMPLYSIPGLIDHH